MVESQEDYTVSFKLFNSDKLVIIDEVDFHKVWNFDWYAHLKAGVYYAMSKGTQMHNLICDAPEVDHRDRDSLNNTQENLRACTHSQNMCNRELPQGPNGSGYRGVRRNGPNWQAKISMNRKTIIIGQYTTKEEAAQAYDKAAKEHHGEFAVLNFPDAD